MCSVSTQEKRALCCWWGQRPDTCQPCFCNSYRCSHSAHFFYLCWFLNQSLRGRCGKLWLQLWACDFHYLFSLPHYQIFYGDSRLVLLCLLVSSLTTFNIPVYLRRVSVFIIWLLSVVHVPSFSFWLIAMFEVSLWLACSWDIFCQFVPFKWCIWIILLKIALLCWPACCFTFIFCLFSFVASLFSSSGFLGH